MGNINRYATRVRQAMDTAGSRTGSPLTIRELAQRTGWSYENVRKTVKGEHEGSREFNAALCRALDLPEEEMWALAEESKVQKRLGLAVLARMPKDVRLVEIWPRLTESDREKLIRIAEGYALAAEALRGASPSGARSPREE